MWLYMAIIIIAWIYCVLAYAVSYLFVLASQIADPLPDMLQVGMIGFNKKLQQAEINGTYTRTEQERTERLQIRWAGYLIVYIITWAFVVPLNVVQFWGTNHQHL